MGRAKVSLWLPPMVEPLGLGGSWIKINQYLCGYAMGTFSIRSRHFGLFFIDYPGCNNNCFSFKILFYVDLPSYKKRDYFYFDQRNIKFVHLSFNQYPTFFINSLSLSISILHQSSLYNLISFYCDFGFLVMLSSIYLNMSQVQTFQFCPSKTSSSVSLSIWNLDSGYHCYEQVIIELTRFNFVNFPIVSHTLHIRHLV